MSQSHQDLFSHPGYVEDRIVQPRNPWLKETAFLLSAEVDGWFVGPRNES